MKAAALILIFAIALSLVSVCQAETDEKKVESPAGHDEQKEQAALEAADAWLRLIDEGKLPESWDQSATIFKAIVTKADWVKQIKSVRELLGKASSRKVQSKVYVTSLPGAPDGQYVVIEYQTTFEKNVLGREIVTPMLDADKKWRVSGYDIK